MTKFLKKELKIENGDIDVAHLVKSRQAPKDSQGRPRPDMILVRFTNLQMKNDVIYRRKQLKGSGYVILEDLTRLNVELINHLKNSKSINSLGHGMARYLD